MSNEPTLTNAAVVAIFNAFQVPALSIPAWAHTLLVVASVVIGALATRAKVTPVKAAAHAPRKRANAGRR